MYRLRARPEIHMNPSRALMIRPDPDAGAVGVANLLMSRCFDAKKSTGNWTYIQGLNLSANDWSEDMHLLS